MKKGKDELAVRQRMEEMKTGILRKKNFQNKIKKYQKKKKRKRI